MVGRKFLGMQFPRARDLGPLLVVFAASMLVLVFQRDLGTALLYFGLFLVMLYVATGRASWIVLGLGCSSAARSSRARRSATSADASARWLDAFNPENYRRRRRQLPARAGPLRARGWRPDRHGTRPGPPRHHAARRERLHHLRASAKSSASSACSRSSPLHAASSRAASASASPGQDDFGDCSASASRSSSRCRCSSSSAASRGSSRSPASPPRSSPPADLRSSRTGSSSPSCCGSRTPCATSRDCRRPVELAATDGGEPMNKELKRVSIVVLLMFLALFASTHGHPGRRRPTTCARTRRNTRTLYDKLLGRARPDPRRRRSDRAVGAVDDEYKFQRVYANGDALRPGHRLLHPQPGQHRHRGRAQRLPQRHLELAVPRPDQRASSPARTPRAPRSSSRSTPPCSRPRGMRSATCRARSSRSSPRPARSSRWSRSPTFDPNLLAVHDTDAVIDTYDAAARRPRRPAVQPRDRAATSTLPVRRSSSSSHRPRSRPVDYTPDSEFPNPPTLPAARRATSIIRNAGGGDCGGGADRHRSPTPCASRATSRSPSSGMQLGDDAIREQADKFGFNESVRDAARRRRRASTRARSMTPQTALTAFGQGRCARSPLQMAMVSAGNRERRNAHATRHWSRASSAPISRSLQTFDADRVRSARSASRHRSEHDANDGRHCQRRRGAVMQE